VISQKLQLPEVWNCQDHFTGQLSVDSRNISILAPLVNVLHSIKIAQKCYSEPKSMGLTTLLQSIRSKTTIINVLSVIVYIHRICQTGKAHVCIVDMCLHDAIYIQGKFTQV
jgi:hypothetical protein